MVLLTINEFLSDAVSLSIKFAIKVTANFLQFIDGVLEIGGCIDPDITLGQQFEVIIVDDI